jgi:hypothetical protein
MKQKNNEIDVRTLNSVLEGKILLSDPELKHLFTDVDWYAETQTFTLDQLSIHPNDFVSIIKACMVLEINLAEFIKLAAHIHANAINNLTRSKPHNSLNKYTQLVSNINGIST